jgi:transporter family protein
MVYLLALIGMICWGISPLFAKSGLEHLSPMTGLSVRTFFTALIILLWMSMSGSIAELKTIPPRVFFLLIAEAVLATLIGDLAYFAALKHGSPSVVMLIMACSPVVTIVCSVFFMGEKMSLTNVLGACLTVIGIILIV